MLSYCHGLRVTELVSLRWDQVDLKQGLMHINRLKHGNASVHPIRGPELRALRRLQRDYSSLCEQEILNLLKYCELDTQAMVPNGASW